MSLTFTYIRIRGYDYRLETLKCVLGNVGMTGIIKGKNIFG